MAAEYLANAVQSVSLNNPVIFTASIPCRKGYVYHEDETGIFVLRGIVNNPCEGYAQYKVTFNGNITIPAGGTVGPVAVAIKISGEERPTSRAIYTPAAVGEANYGNVTSTAIVKVPKGCCFSMSIDAVPASTTGTPAPVINVQNANLVVERIA